MDVRLRVSSPGVSAATCTRTFDARTWYQTFLIFVYPFRSPAYGRAKATEALALDCLVEALGRVAASSRRQGR